MMYKINKEFHFSASHILSGLHAEHPCSRLHGHNYVVDMHFQSDTLNDVGFVIDYKELEPVKKFIDDELDHKHLNEIFDFNPTAENLAKFVFCKFKSQFPQLYKVVISETPKTKVSYENA